jgi:hypothetical protein
VITLQVRLPAEQGGLVLKAIELTMEQDDAGVSAETLTNHEGVACSG